METELVLERFGRIDFVSRMKILCSERVWLYRVSLTLTLTPDRGIWPLHLHFGFIQLDKTKETINIENGPVSLLTTYTPGVSVSLKDLRY